MAKVDVILTAVLDNGLVQRQPGETVSMERGQAEKLAALGMVRLQETMATDRPVRGRKPKSVKTGDDPSQRLSGIDDPDAGDGEGEESGGEEDSGLGTDETSDQ